MSSCPACKAENHRGSKFCAGCGAALPKAPINVPCAACGAESPEGSRFCKGCGRPVGVLPVPKQGQRSPGGGPGAGGAAAGPKAQSQTTQRIKMLLGGGAALYALAIFLMYSQVSQISQMQTMYGAYAGAMTNSGLLWFLIVLDAALACLNVYAISLIGKGEHKYAKWLLVAMGVLGAIFLLRALSGPVIYIFLNAGLLAGGVYGWMLVSRVDKGLAN
jgi:hypothetical protein